MEETPGETRAGVNILKLRYSEVDMPLHLVLTLIQVSSDILIS